GKYYVIETSAPSGYAIDATGNKSVHVVAGVTADVTFENEALPQVGGIRITKLDADTEAPLSGAVFSIYQFIDANAAPATANLTLIESGLTSDSSGRVVKTGLTPGKYYVIETSAPSGYAIDATGNKSVHVVAGLTSDVTFENEALPQYGSLMITKQDITNDAYLSGAVFRVYRYIDADGDPVAANLTFLNELTSNVTAANPTGSVGLTGLDPGKYFVEETVAPAGYLDDDTDKTAVVVAGESVTVAFRNSPIIDIPDEDPPGGDVNPKTGSNDLLLCIVSMLIVLIALGRFLIRKPARRQA
ncbi:MAG: MSCRAMM family protein, partial [Christensenellales bacterium]